jgi:hypothetical protein
MDVDNAMRELAEHLSFENGLAIIHVLRESGLADTLRAGQAMRDVWIGTEAEDAPEMRCIAWDAAIHKFEAWLANGGAR